MLIQIDNDLNKTLRAQVIEKIKAMIEDNSLEAGSPMPSLRKLAEQLGVSRCTVYQAYSELQAMGYLLSRPGSYNIVQNRKKEAGYNPNGRSLIPWQKISNQSVENVYSYFRSQRETKSYSYDFNFSSLEPDPRLFPVKEFSRSVNFALNYYGSKALNYGDHRGFLPLREYLAKRFRTHGISVSEKEILITNGAQQGIDLVLRLFAIPGKTVIIEAPTYGVLIPLLKLHNAKVKSVPMLEDGMDLHSLERLLKKGDTAFIYTMPNFHNPTGITTSHLHREKLLTLCHTYNVPLIEDGFEEDLKYFGRVDLPIKSIDHNNVVIYLGTFSKALFPGLRIGWICAAPECVDRLTCIKRYSDLSSGNLSQAAIHYFCEHGYYDLHLKRLHRIYKKRMEAAQKTLENSFPEGFGWTKPAGGYLLWIKMPFKLTDDEFQKYFSRQGIGVSPGMHYFYNCNESEFFRISISAMDEKEIREGLCRLAGILKNLAAEKGGRK